MGSFQQVVMGGICLVAAFWFGSYINEQPDALQQPLQGIKNAFVNAGNSRFQVPPQLPEKPQSGLLSSFVDAPAKPHSITLSDLKSRSTFTPSNVVVQNSPAPLPVSQGQRSVEQLIDSTTEVVSDFVNPPTPDFRGDPSFTSNNYNAQAVSNTQINQQPLEINYTQPRDQQRLEIVPDFSTLAENFKREQAEQFQRNRQLVATPAAAEQPSSMLPVPKLDDFSRTSFGNSTAQPNRDWNAVRQGVMSVQEKLKQFHNAHPVAEEFEPLRAVDPGFPVAATTLRDVSSLQCVRQVTKPIDSKRSSLKLRYRSMNGRNLRGRKPNDRNFLDADLRRMFRATSYGLRANSVAATEPVSSVLRLPTALLIQSRLLNAKNAGRFLETAHKHRKTNWPRRSACRNVLLRRGLAPKGARLT